jgi:hypothetical protein
VHSILKACYKLVNETATAAPRPASGRDIGVPEPQASALCGLQNALTRGA